MLSRLAAAAAILLALTACGRKEEAKAPKPTPAPVAAPLTGFAHDAAFDAAGYYKPAIDLTIGNHRLSQVSVGAPSDFAEWEGGQREGLFGPILVEFDDITSPLETNELGQSVHKVRLRVLPEAYSLSSGTITFKGKDAVLGEVRINGAFDETAFKAARDTGSSGSTPVLVAVVQVGDAVIRDRKFTFFVGD